VILKHFKLNAKLYSLKLATGIVKDINSKQEFLLGRHCGPHIAYKWLSWHNRTAPGFAGSIITYYISRIVFSYYENIILWHVAITFN